MKLYLTDQTKNFPQLLHYFSSLQVMKYNKNLLKERISVIDLPADKPINDLDLDFFFAYKIFPPHIMSFFTQWHHERRDMQVGDTIIQQVFIPPLGSFSQKIIVGVRISEIIDETDKKGYSYETLEGHVERGISTFTIEQKGNSVVCVIKTFSEPGNILTKLLGPIFSLPYQAYCTKQALINVKAKVH